MSSPVVQPATPPPGAVCVPPSTGNPVNPNVQAQSIAQEQLYYQQQNALALAAFQGQCATWAVNAQQCQNLGIPLPPMPQQPTALALWEWGTIGNDVYIMQGTAGLLGSPCPPLAAPPALPPVGTPAIGINVGGLWYQCLATDTMPTNGIVIVSSTGGYTTTSSTAGAGLTCPAGTYEKQTSPWGSLYYKVA